ncbi:alpha/beta hydrolase [uncultured Tateyamaria sp.]|uniref:alpha/beta fold hydrolase n=1 Tax=uncultured Tateyamaria sp. TaxID=455651 RepID=UPI00261AD81D|nr:alpha/beta hydrolase [uncultured Tateyamaria sp.]
MRFVYLILLALLSACTPRHSAESPLFFDHAAALRADTIIVATPGALTSISVMRDLERFATPDRALVYYRLPGLDGRPQSDPFNIHAAADSIVRFVQHYDFDTVLYVGFSTGNAINLEAAKRLATERQDITQAVAGISTALPAPQPILAGVRGFAGNVSAATRVDRLSRRDIWLEYYKTLLFGGPRDQPEPVRKSAQTIADANAPRIEVPDAEIAGRHGTALLGWRNAGADRLGDVDIGLFHGARDPVFPLRAVLRFAEGLPKPATVVSYDNNGHLLMITQPRLFDHVFAYFADVAE